MKTDLYCLKVENKKSSSVDMYFRDNLTDIVRLKQELQYLFPKKLYSIRKVIGVPLLSCLTLSENDIRALIL